MSSVKFIELTSQRSGFKTTEHVVAHPYFWCCTRTVALHTGVHATAVLIDGVLERVAATQAAPRDAI